MRQMHVSNGRNKRIILNCHHVLSGPLTASTKSTWNENITLLNVGSGVRTLHIPTNRFRKQDVRRSEWEL